MAQQSVETRGGDLGWVYVNSVTLSGASTAITLNNGYPVYKLYFSNIVLSADDQWGCSIQVNVGGTAQTATTDYWWITNGLDNIAATEATAVTGDENDDQFYTIGSVAQAANENPGTDGGATSYAEVTIIGLNLAKPTYINSMATWFQGAAMFAHNHIGGAIAAEACDGITLNHEGATTCTGQVYIMGLNIGT